MRDAAVILLIAGTCCQAADVAVLADGDRLTGTIQKMEKGKLFLLSKYSKAPLQIDWTLVSSLTSESEIKITRQDGKQETGKLLASGAVTAFQPSTIVALEPKADEDVEDTSSWLRRAWAKSSVSVDLDQSYSGLSQYNQLSSSSELKYTGDRWDGSLITHYDYYGATDSAGSTYQAYSRFLAERYIGGDHFFLFPYAFLGRQTTSDGGRGQIRQYGGGAGWTFRRQYADQVSLFAGLVRSIGSGFTMAPDQVRVDARVADTLFVAAASWDKVVKHKIKTSVKLYYFKPIHQAGHTAMATDASAKIPLFGPAYFTIRAYDTPELRQRRLFSSKNLQLSSGIGIEF